MKTRISVQERLKDLRVERGLNLEELAQETGISKSALGSYENDNDEYKEINHGSLLKLADFYKVSVDYLLGLTNNRKYENTPIEELHLSDEVVELLKSERFNNRLLCEIISMKNSRNCWQTQKSMWMEWQPCVMILSRLVDTFFSRISLTMQPPPKPHSTACVLPWEEGRHWQSRSSGCSSS